MLPTQAEVLATLAHEFRTPLAVSQGYLGLLRSDQLTDENDRRRALQLTRDAMSQLSTLCEDMSRVSALAAEPAPPFSKSIRVADFVTRLQSEAGLARATWTTPDARQLAEHLLTYDVDDLVTASGALLKAAVFDAREGVHAWCDVGAHTVTILAGAQTLIERLRTGPGAPQVRAMDFARGGHGLRLIWAGYVLQRHDAVAWSLVNNPAAIGLRLATAAV
jgi:hypothetical protein